MRDWAPISRRCCSPGSASAHGLASWRRSRWPRHAARSSAFWRSASASPASISRSSPSPLPSLPASASTILTSSTPPPGCSCRWRNMAHNDLWRLRGSPTMFYYVILAATVFALILSRLLLRSRMGYFWLAIREDEQAARAAGIDTFRYKMYAVMISAAVTSFAGVFYAFFYNNLFPEQVFNISRSIEMILGPIIGGIGTLVRADPRRFRAHRACRIRHFGAGRVRRRSARREADLLRHLFAARRRGAAGRHLAVAGAPARHSGARTMTALLSLDRVSKRFRGLLAVDAVSFDVPEGVIFAVIGPNGAGKTTLFNMIAGAMAPDDGAIAFAGAADQRPDARCGVPARHRAHVSAGAAVPGVERRGQRHRRRLAASPRRRRGARARFGACCGGSTCSTSATRSQRR